MLFICLSHIRNVLARVLYSTPVHVYARTRARALVVRIEVCEDNVDQNRVVLSPPAPRSRADLTELGGPLQYITRGRKLSTRFSSS